MKSFRDFLRESADEKFINFRDSLDKFRNSVKAALADIQSTDFSNPRDKNECRKVVDDLEDLIKDKLTNNFKHIDLRGLESSFRSIITTKFRRILKDSYENIENSFGDLVKDIKSSLS